MKEQTIEILGIIPRSIIRTLDRLRRQLFIGEEDFDLALQEYRITRAIVRVSVKTLIFFFFFPPLFNFFIKKLVVRPLTEFLWNNFQTEIFLNLEQETRALKEMQNFEEILYFESLIDDTTTSFLDFLFSQEDLLKINLQVKAFEIAFDYNQESILALTELFGDLLTIVTVLFFLILLRPQLSIVQVFLLEYFFSLNDALKSFLFIFFTDLLVGFHSSHGWDVFLDTLFTRFGLPENTNFKLVFIAIVPVILDTLFKYWVFRFLNRSSPATVATYHTMIE